MCKVRTPGAAIQTPGTVHTSRRQTKSLIFPASLNWQLPLDGGKGKAVKQRRTEDEHRHRFRSTQPFISPGSINRVPASDVVMAGTSTQSGGGIYKCVIPYDM